MATPMHQLEKIRRHRSRPARDLTIGGVIRATQEQSQRTQKKFGDLIEIWERLIPIDLASHTSLVNFRAGVLHVSVDSSSASFDLDRLLRNGVECELRRQFRGTLVRVKTRISGPERTAPVRRTSKR